MASPAYDIYAIPTAGGVTPIFGQGISTSGNYAAAMVQPTSNTANGVLYNVLSNTSTLESQMGVTYNSTAEKVGVPVSVNNNGIMFGASGLNNISETFVPTVWRNGQAYNLALPSNTSAGNVYACNNLNQAVGSVNPVLGVNLAAVFNYNASSPSSSYATNLGLSPFQTSGNGMLQLAFGINDSGVIVGTASSPTNQSINVPFILNFGAGQTTAEIIPYSSPAFNTGIPWAISNSGLVTGDESTGTGASPFLYNSSSGITTAIPLVAGTATGGGRSINDFGEVVGTDAGTYAVPFLFDGANSYDLQSLLVNNQSGAWELDNNTSSSAYGIADNGDIVGRALDNGVLTAFILVPASVPEPGSLIGLGALASLALLRRSVR
jgi:hypothetical protein